MQPLTIDISTQAEGRKQKPDAALVVDDAGFGRLEPPIAQGSEVTAPRSAVQVPRGRQGLRSLILVGMLAAAFGLGWAASLFSHRSLNHLGLNEATDAVDINTVVEQIIKVESNGDPNAKSKRSSAAGLGQFLDETWLILIRTHRPDLAKGRNEGEILELRRDAGVAREITSRFTERNASVLRRRGLPVTPGTLYLAHFAGAAGAVAILSALEQADAASIMASADATGRTKREKLIKANPFLERFTIADLKSWADRKMRIRRS
jgi:hypothetical protein